MSAGPTEMKYMASVAQALRDSMAADPRVIVVADRRQAHYQGDKMSRLARHAIRAGAAVKIQAVARGRKERKSVCELLGGTPDPARL